MEGSAGNEVKSYLAARISTLRQLSLYMQSYGIQCFVPKKFSCKSGYIAYVMNPEEIKALFRAFDAAIPSEKGRISKHLAMEDSILFRVIFCCGLRVSEWFFPASDPQKPLQVASLEKHFREAWDRTPYAGPGSSQSPGPYSLSYVPPHQGHRTIPQRCGTGNDCGHPWPCIHGNV